MRHHKGFTLLELIVVSAVISITASAGLFGMSELVRATARRDAELRFVHDVRAARAVNVKRGYVTVVKTIFVPGIGGEPQRTRVVYATVDPVIAGVASCDAIDSGAPTVSMTTSSYTGINVVSETNGVPSSSVCFADNGQPANASMTVAPVAFDITHDNGQSGRVDVDRNGGLESAWDKDRKDGAADTKLRAHDHMSKDTPNPIPFT